MTEPSSNQSDTRANARQVGVTASHPAAVVYFSTVDGVPHAVSVPLTDGGTVSTSGRAASERPKDRCDHSTHNHVVGGPRDFAMTREGFNNQVHDELNELVPLEGAIWMGGCGSAGLLVHEIDTYLSHRCFEAYVAERFEKVYDENEFYCVEVWTAFTAADLEAATRN